MEVVVRARTAAIGAIETHDVEVLVFHPDAAGEASLARLGQWLHVEHQGSDFTEKLPADIVKLVVLLVEAVRVQVDHLQEAVRQKLHGERKHIAEAAKHFMLDAAAGLIAVRQRFKVDALGKKRATEEIMVAGRNGAQGVVFSEIL